MTIEQVKSQEKSVDIRTGFGIDFHRLVYDPQRPFILGGVKIESEGLALEGHSDADILIHALSDSLLGALGLGDIGDFFPDTDPANKGMDSKNILSFALKHLSDQNFSISNTDLTMIGEKPKISPYKTKIRSSLAELLNIPLARISLKATSTEKMGAIGRKEGLGCVANVLIIQKYS